MITGHVHPVASIDPNAGTTFGGKATGLARMSGLGLRVPPAFVIDTEMCRRYLSTRTLPDRLAEDVREALEALEEETGRRFAGGGRPLLVSVRSGASVSMPGMMDTVLNLGLDSRSVLVLATMTADQRFAVETWVRFWCMYADIVLDVDPDLLRQALGHAPTRLAAELTAVGAAELESRVVAFFDAEGFTVSTDPWDQLLAAVEAVFASWTSRRAVAYRKHQGISDDLGTAVTIQAMVFGNLGSPAGSGVAFTRDPATGRPDLYGEFLPGGQGEEVVAGTATPVPLAAADAAWEPLVTELRNKGEALEREYTDALDIEFTVEDGTLYFLQVRPAKRTAAAAVAVAVSLVAEGAIDATEALRRVSVDQLDTLVSPVFDPEALARSRASGRLLTTGIPASPGHASGEAVMDPDAAAAAAAEGRQVILLRPTTSPQDLAGMLASEGVVTARGGATSHAAVVSRALDKACVVGCAEIEVSPQQGVFTVGGQQYPGGTEISIDGGTGEIFLGALLRQLPAENLGTLTTLLGWADEASGAEVWLNARQPGDLALLDPRRGGIGPIGITDLLVEQGRLDTLVAAVGAYGSGHDLPGRQVDEPVEADVAKVVADLLRKVPDGARVDLRMPGLMSARARRLVDQWTSLRPELLLPLGPLGLITAMLRGVARAAGEAPGVEVSVCIGRITSADEMATFAGLVAEQGGLHAGATVQNVAALSEIDDIRRHAGTVWIDVPEIIRSFHGYPEELLLTVSELTASEAGGRTTPGGHVLMRPGLRRLVAGGVPAASGTCRVGIELHGVGNLALAIELFDLGYHSFSRSPLQAQQLRLVLGRRANERR